MPYISTLIWHLQDIVADGTGKDWDGGTSGNDSEQVIPTSLDTTAMLLNQLTERDGHLLLDRAGVVDVTRDTEQLGSSVTRTAKAGEPGTTTTQDGGGDGNGLDVGDSGGAAEKTDISGEWGLQSGLTSLSFDRLDQGGFLTANISASTAVNVNIEVVS